MQKIQKIAIPYKGSKRGIAERLIQEVQKYKPNAKYFIDVFGGGAMSFTALQSLIPLYNFYYCRHKEVKIYN